MFGHVRPLPVQPHSPLTFPALEFNYARLNWIVR